MKDDRAPFDGTLHCVLVPYIAERKLDWQSGKTH
jgi:hypothetical protein